MKHTRRILSALLALLMLTTAALAEGVNFNEMDETLLINEEGANGIVGYSEADALAEESALDAFDAQPGDYEWYLLPVNPIDSAAYVDVYPTADPILHADGTWTFSFTMEETTGIWYQPYVLTLIFFTGEQEVRRDAHDIETLEQWWRDSALLRASAVVYEGTVTDADITAVAVSIIGLDEYGNEQEFHSLIDIRGLAD